MNTSTSLSLNTKSVRFRLTALYSSTLIFSLAILFVSFFWLTRRELYNHTDTVLQSHATRIVSILGSQLETERQMSSQFLADVFAETPGMLVLVANEDGEVLSVSQNVADAHKITTEILKKSPVADSPVFLNSAVGVIDMRFIVMPLGGGGNVRDILIVAHPIDVIQQSLQALYGSLSLVFLSFVIPTIFGGYMLAGSALRPVAEVSRQMDKISSENLTQRVKLPDTQDEIAALVVTFNSLLDRLEESFTRERQFIADVAHELKTPLSTLKTSIEVTAAKPRSSAEYQQLLEELLVDANRLSATLTNILDLAWSRSDKYTHKVAVNMSEVMRELVEIAEKLGLGKNISITTRITDDLSVYGQRDKLFRALLNIIDNAVKYSPEKGVVEILLQKKHDQAWVLIKDHGRGIGKNDLHHIFDRFYRGSEAHKTSGSGLGLAIAKAVITAYSGTVDVESVVGRGTQVTVKFPLFYS